MSASLAGTRVATDHGPISKQLFRQVMGRFATGVTVVTTTGSNQVYGMTANAFMAGSLEPMLGVISINRTAQMHERLRQTDRTELLGEWARLLP